jgi:L-asparaginase II
MPPESRSTAGLRAQDEKSHIGYQPVVEVVRGRVVESVHYGAVAVADAQGNLHAWWGDPETATFLRSSAKPFQALPLVESGAADRFGLTPAHLAVICASHSGTDDHVEMVRSVQALTGVREATCSAGPTSRPRDRAPVARRGRGAHAQPSQLFGQAHGHARACHSWACLLPATPTLHPVQERILNAFAEMCGISPEEIGVAIDGCSVPTFAHPASFSRHSLRLSWRPRAAAF